MLNHDQRAEREDRWVRRCVVAGVVFIVFGLGLIGWTVTAHATIIVCEPCSYPYQRWANESKVPTPVTTLRVVEGAGPCEDAIACTVPSEATIWFEGAAFGNRQTFYHELGHNFDYLVLPEWARARYIALLGREPQPWLEPTQLSRSPNELFAESYALCAFQLRITSGLAVRGQHPPGGRRVHNEVCRIVTQID